MLSIGQAILLGIIQGITEFFPISSSGHLVLAQELLGVNPPELVDFNVLVHLATLFAVVFYFRIQLVKLVHGVIKRDKEQLKLFWAITLGTIPAVLVALFFGDQIEAIFLTAKPVLIAMLCTGLFFIAAEYFKAHKPTNDHPGIVKGVIIGIAQAIALIPGVSRSGSTLATGLFMKFDREKAAEFSFLLAIPAIAGAAVYTAMDIEGGLGSIDWLTYGAGFIAALLSGYFSIAILMQLYKKHSLNIFAGYLITLFIIGMIFV